MRLKKKNAFIALLILLMITGSVCLLFISPRKKINSNSTDTDNSITVITMSPTLPSMVETLSPDTQTTAVPESYGINTDSLKTSIKLDIPYISQYPELPTGNEITALAQALTYYGYNEDKEALAQNYLKMSDNASEGCFTEYFYGSPWSNKGLGCFAPAIINAANSYLKGIGSDLRASSMCYSSIEMLLNEVSQGNTVLVWTSTNYSIEKIPFRNITLEDNTKFAWPYYETCVVISGYDLSKETITFVDPTQGEVTQNLYKFKDYYEQMYYQALVIKK